MRYMMITSVALVVLFLGMIVIGLINPAKRTSLPPSKAQPIKKRSVRPHKQTGIAELPKMVQLTRCSFNGNSWTIIHRPPKFLFDFPTNAPKVHLQFKDQNGQWVDTNDQSVTARWFRVCARAPNASDNEKDLDQQWLHLNWKQVSGGG